MEKKKKTSWYWTQEDRNVLECLVREGYPISKIVEHLDASRATIYNELRRGLTEEEYKNHQYVKYSAEKSIENSLNMAKERLVKGSSKYDF